MLDNTITNLFVAIKNIPTKVGVSWRRKIHPTILGMMPDRRTFDLKLLNERPKVDGPALYIVSHSTCHDAPIACELIEDHFYILVGKQKLEIMDYIFFFLNGAFWVDRNNEQSESKVFKQMVRKLKNGINVVSLSEQTWCTEPSSPINPLRRGWVKVAKQANVPVIPLALEYYEYTDNICYAKFGDPVYIQPEDDIIEKNEEMEDTFASLKYEIWEEFPMRKRKLVNENEWKEIIKRRNAEYPKLNPQFENQFVIGYQNKPDYVFQSKEFQEGFFTLSLNMQKKRDKIRIERQARIAELQAKREKTLIKK